MLGGLPGPGSSGTIHHQWTAAPNLRSTGNGFESDISVDVGFEPG